MYQTEAVGRSCVLNYLLDVHMRARGVVLVGDVAVGREHRQDGGGRLMGEWVGLVGGWIMYYFLK